tara:strand:+ start:146 stop:367 length:222 start_codon:yes stop_codon:yes gene_type:complete
MSAGPNIGVIVHLGYEAGGDTGDVEKYAPKINAYDNFVSLEIGTVSFFLNDLEEVSALALKILQEVSEIREGF